MDQSTMQLHICGQCGQKFAVEELYLAHQCPETGVAPTQPESMGPNHEAISKAALARGSKQNEAPVAQSGNQPVQ